MSTHARTSIAYRFANDTDVKLLPMQRSGRKRALGFLLGSLLLLGSNVSHTVQAQPVAFTTASLQGRYAYVDNVGRFGSLGLIVFDGHGGTAVQIKVSEPSDTAGGRTMVTLKGSGTYTVDPDTGTGVAVIQFESVPGQTTYDFVITGLNDKLGFGGQPLAKEVSALSRTEGVAGQLVAPVTPTWKRISD